jgi:DNA polymerase I-like protein with 3'-5' exonuclease and polymerase domains
MGIVSELKAKGLWRGYDRHVRQLNPVLEAMSERGMPVSPASFDQVVAKLEADFKAALDKMQELVPLEAKKVTTYKKVPKNKTGCFEKDGVWYKVHRWTPSNQGLLKYIVAKGHPIPTDFKTKRKTTNKLEIARLSRTTKDALYATVLSYRKAQTVLSNHVKNWKPGSDDRVHATFYFDPATGQLSSRRPNVQNAPKHDDPEFGGYGKVFRSMIAAKPDHMIMEFDYKAFHIQTAGFEAQDANMMRLGRLDIHSYIAAHFLKLPGCDYLAEIADDKELGAKLAAIKKAHKFVRDNQAKHAILGYINGLGYTKLYNLNKEYFDSKMQAKRLMDMLDVLFPPSARWRKAIVERAHQQGYLISRHGHIRYFWEVYRWKDGEWTHGDDHEAALSFFIQNDAHGELRDRILVLAEKELDKRYGLVNTIHDSIIFECPIDLVQECVYTVKEIMESPSRVLIDPVVAPNGLSVEVDVQGGADWANMKGLA